MKQEPLSTEELLKLLDSSLGTSELDQYVSQLPPADTSRTFSSYINQLLTEKHLQSADVIRDSQIQRNYGYQILDGTKNPGRDKVIAICLSASCTLEETQRALALAKAGALYPKKIRDSILIFALNRQLSVSQTNELLYEYKEAPL